MVGRALPEAAKRRLIFEEADHRAHKATRIYQESQEAAGRGEILKARSLRDVAEEYGVSHMKISRLLKPGAMTLAERNRSRGHLTPEEEVVLRNDLKLSGLRGLPRTHEEIEEYVNYLLKMKHGDGFKPIGVIWLDNFILRHREELKTFAWLVL